MLCVCYIFTMGAEPGDIFIGHILGRDNVWHRLAEEEQPQIAAPPETALVVQQLDPVNVQPVDLVHVQRVGPAPQASKPDPGPSYWARYKSRWFFTAWMVGLVSGLAVTMVQTWREPDFVVLLTFIMASITTGLVFGSLVNVLVALHQGAPQESRQPAGPRGAPIVATDVPANGKPMAILVCPDCDETVSPEDWALHPRYCLGRGKSLRQLIFNE